MSEGRRLALRLAPRVGLIVVALVGVGCDSEPPESCVGVRLLISDAAGDTPAAFQVTLTPEGGEPLADFCDAAGSATGAVTCEATGAFVAGRRESFALVVKARGSRFFRDDYAPSFSAGAADCPDNAAIAEVEVTLAALPAAEITGDYVTGFAAGSGAVDFASLAVEVPGELGIARAVKFFISDLDAEPRLYFQNTVLHPLHYGFVRSVLGETVSMAEYEAATYHGDDRQQMAGTIVAYPDLAVDSAAWDGAFLAPYTIEFFPSDDLSPALALLAHGLIEERAEHLALDGAADRLFYVPAGATADADLVSEASTFAAETALWLHPEELYSDVRLQILNPGVAFGTLRRLDPTALATTPVSYRDVLVLTRLPNDLPVVGGTITEELQTPLAHVNVAARTRGTPNLALLEAGSDPRVAPWLDALVRFEVFAGDFELRAATVGEAEAFWASLIPTEPFVPAADLATRGLLPFADLAFADADAVGVKAANLAELVGVLGEGAPDGFAVPFAHYEDFVITGAIDEAGCAAAAGDCFAEGRASATCADVESFCLISGAAGETLAAYRDRLLDDGRFQTDTAYREAALDGLRFLIHHLPVETGFAAELDAEVGARFGDRRVRLRSSTNAEDLEQFSGAGLYRSISAQAGGTIPPSSRIRKVWGSVWSWAAFEERAFWNIDHRAVKMGVAVHRSFPDEIANGVLITQNLADCGVSGFYVNLQLGETSVTNPVGGVLPEVFSLVAGVGGPEVIRQRYSTLSPGAPIMTDAELAALWSAATAVRDHFAVLYGANPQTFALELELKLESPHRNLVIKQARPYFTRAGEGACN